MDLGLESGLQFKQHTERAAASHNSIFKWFGTEEILFAYHLLPENMFCPLTAELLVLHPKHHASWCALCFTRQKILGSRHRLTAALDAVSALGVLWILDRDEHSMEHPTGLNLMLKAKGSISIIVLAQSSSLLKSNNEFFITAGLCILLGLLLNSLCTN